MSDVRLFGSGWVETRREAVLAAAFPFIALSLLNHFYMEPLYQLSPIAYWIADTAQFVGAPLVGWYFFLRPAGVLPRTYGLAPMSRRFCRRDGVALTVFVALLLVAAYWPVRLIAIRLFWTLSAPFNHGLVLPDAFLSNFLVAVFMAGSAALVEEAVWRGLTWYYLSQVLPVKGRRFLYVLITSVAFAIAHSEQGPAGVIGAFWFGIIAAGLYTTIRTLWPLVLGHFVADMLVFGPWR